MGRFSAALPASLSSPPLPSPILSLITLNLGVGCAPSCWPIFGFRTSWVLAGGTEGSFLCSLITDFLAEGAGWGAPPGRGGELGCQGAAGAKKICEIGVGFSFAAHSEPFESQGARAAKRYVNGNLVEREKGDEFGIKLLLPHRLSPVGSKK